MALCKDCMRNMSREETTTCTKPNIHIMGKVFKRDTAYFDVNTRCHDCNILNKTGNVHHFGCDVERCPRCKSQLISCSCRNKYLLVKKGKKMVKVQ